MFLPKGTQFTVNVFVDNFARPFVDHVHVGRRYAPSEVGALKKVQRVPAFLAPYAPARAPHGRFEDGLEGRRRRRRRRRRGGRRTRRRPRRGRRRRRFAAAAVGRAQRTARTAVVVLVVVRATVVIVVVVVVSVDVRRILQVVAPRAADPTSVRLRRPGHAEFFAGATARRRRSSDHRGEGCDCRR